MSNICLAVSQHPLCHVSQFSDYQALVSCRVKNAVEQGAQILLFAEYASFELASLFEKQPPQLQIDAMQVWLDDYLTLYQNLAAQHNCLMVTPSFLVKEDDQVINTCWIVTPTDVYMQDKLHLTQHEKGIGLSPGTGLTVIDYLDIKLVVAVCYDSEFPSQVNTLCKRGARLILVPSCTDNWHGYNRVNIACRARAMENQCYVAQAY